MQTNLNYLKKKFNVKRLVKRKKYKPYKKLLNNNKYNWWRLKRLIFLINKLTFIEKFISFGYNRNKPLNLFKVKLLLKKEKVKKRFYFKFSWKKKVFRRYRYFWRIKKIKLNKKFGKIKGNTQRNIIKNFFVIKALKLKEFKTSTINFLNKTKKISNYIKLRYKIRRKKRKLIANLKRWIKRRKKRKVHKNSLKLRKKGKRILKKKRKIRLHSKKNDFVWRVKWRNHRLFITMPKVFIKRRKSKRFFKKKFLYSKKFKRRRLKIKKFFKKALKRVLKKKNRYYKIEREFLFLWKQKIKKKSKRFNSILSKELMQKYKKWENERWKIKKSKNKGKKKKKKKSKALKLRLFRARVRKYTFLFYRRIAKKVIKLGIDEEINIKWNWAKILKYKLIKKKKRWKKMRRKKVFGQFKTKHKKKTRLKKRWIHRIWNSKLNLKLSKIKRNKFNLLEEEDISIWKQLLGFFHISNRKQKRKLYGKQLSLKKKKKQKTIIQKKIKKKTKWIKKIRIIIKKKKIIKSFIPRKKRKTKKRKYPTILYWNKNKKQKIKIKKNIKTKSNKFNIIKKKLNFLLRLWIETQKKFNIRPILAIEQKKMFFKAKFEFSRSKKKHETWEKTKQRLRRERKIRIKRKRKNIKKLKRKKISKIKNEILKKNPKINKIKVKWIKKIFNRKAKIYYQKKKKHLQNNVFIRKRNKNKKLVFYLFKTKKWNIQLNNKTSKTIRNQRKIKRSGRRVKKNKIFYYIKKLQSGDWERKRRKVFQLRETLKKFIKKTNKSLPNNIKKYFSNPNKKKRKENLENFSNNFINNINILVYRIGMLPSLSLSIEAVKQNWFCINFEIKRIKSSVVEIGDTLSIYPSFEIYSNYIWMKQVYIKQIYAMNCSKKEFYFNKKKPFLFFFIKIRKKTPIVNNSPKDWIKLAYLRNLKLIP